MSSAPRSGIELYATEALLDPFPLYKTLRDIGPVVWLEAYGMFILSRYADVKAALANWEVFSSAGGVTMNDEMNAKLKGAFSVPTRRIMTFSAISSRSP
jgi:cytochrome P450